MINKIDCLKGVVVSEKSRKMASSTDFPCVTFLVDPLASKTIIASAVEASTGFRVSKVRTAACGPARTTRFGNVYGRRTVWKKAYVTFSTEVDLAVFGLSAI